MSKREKVVNKVKVSRSLDQVEINSPLSKTFLATSIYKVYFIGKY